MTCDLTFEELAAFAAGDIEPPRQGSLREHVAACEHCRQRVEALSKVDAAIASLPRLEPSLEALLATRRAVSDIIRPGRGPEILTLEEVAAFLRVTAGQLGEVLEELPAFELGGQVRVRRSALLEWIEQRERDFRRQNNESWIARSRVLGLGQGVA